MQFFREMIIGDKNNVNNVMGKNTYLILEIYKLPYRKFDIININGY